MFFFLGGGATEACGILALQPGMEPNTLALEGEVLITGLPGKFLALFSSLRICALFRVSTNTCISLSDRYPFHT